MATAPTRLVCPSCGKFLCTVEGVSVECPPCSCGVQTTVRLTRRARQTICTPSGPLEVKSA